MIPRNLLTKRSWGLSLRAWKVSGKNAAATISCLHTWSDVSPRDLASLEDKLWRSIGADVVDPILQKDLGSLKWLDRRIEVAKNGETAKLTVRLPTQLYPSKEELKERVQAKASEEVEEWISKHIYELDGRIDVEVTAAKPVPAMSKYVENHEELLKQLGPGLVNVSQYLAVYSCKGGVGKSTVAANLAYEMARMGGRVGLLDIDIYGPSLAIIVQPDDPSVRPSPLGKGMVYPIEHEGVKLLSLGYVSPNSGVPGSGPAAGAAVMRGPMAGKVVTQLVKGTDWGDLDVLILDLPPGTGDVQLAICQELQLSGAVAVTTPSKLATEDTRKGIEMFTSLGVPTLGVVENMSYFMCEGGSKHHPFGRGLQGLPFVDSIPKSSVVQLPISSVTNDANDNGAPICLARPSTASDELVAFEQLASVVSKELLRLRYSDPDSDGVVVIGGVRFELESLSCSIETGKDAFSVRLYSESGATKVSVPAADIRGRDPKTGELLSASPPKVEGKEASMLTGDGMVTVHKKKDPSTTPTSIERKGRYGFAVEWDDGATIIYTMHAIAEAAAATQR